jgi:hypothetical protein
MPKTKHKCPSPTRNARMKEKCSRQNRNARADKETPEPKYKCPSPTKIVQDELDMLKTKIEMPEPK